MRSARTIIPTIVLLLFLGGSVAWGRTEGESLPPGRPAVRLFTSKDGLPQNSAMHLAFDRSGYLWVATQDGVAAFNGRQWNVVNMPNRALSNFITAMLVTGDGAAWFGTAGGGVCRFHRGTWTVLDHTRGLPDDRVTGLAEVVGRDGSSRIWAATLGGLAFLQNDAWQRADVVGRGATPIKSLFTPRQRPGELWIVSQGAGLEKLVGDRLTAYDAASGLPPEAITCLYESRAGTIFAGTVNGTLLRLDGAGRWDRIVTEVRDGITAIAETGNHTGATEVWIGTDGSGVLRRRGGRWENLTDTFGLPSRSIWYFLPRDTPSGITDTLWIGTDAGLASVKFGRWTAYDTSLGLPSNSIYGMCETVAPDGTRAMWFGTRGTGLVRFQNGIPTVFDTRDGLPSNTVFGLCETVARDGKRVLWIGTQTGGLARFENGAIRPERVPGLDGKTVRTMISTRGDDGEPVLWVTTGNAGLFRLERGVWTHFDTGNSGLPTNALHSVLETREPDGRRTLWVGTQGKGLARWSRGQWEVFTTASGLPNETIMSLAETVSPTGRRRLWIGTEGGGVVVRDPANDGDQWTILSETSTPALPNNTVYQIRVDARNRVYLFTNKGVARVEERPSGGFGITTFTMDDGLPNNEFNGGASCLDGRGRIWGGSVGGAVVFDPEAEITETLTPTLTIESFQVNGAARGTDAPTLRHNENALTFEFALLNYFRDGETQYRTQLIGFDEHPTAWSHDWKKEYTSLGEGSYRFEVWARDYAGKEFGPVTRSFTIRPAPWRTWWAYAVYALLAGGFGYGGVWLRIRTLNRRNQLLEAKVAERTTELDRKNVELATTVEEVRLAKQDVEAKNAALAEAVAKLESAKLETERKNRELDQKIAELIASQQQADRIFSALADALPGTVLEGKYQLVEKIGAGGFGVVFKARHLTLDRFVAVKVFKPTPGNDSAESVERFKREGISAARLNHPNAIAILDSGISAEGIAYLVMELLSGDTLLQEMRRRGRLSPRRCAEILLPICRALEEAHRLGIIHRDIKPENIFLHHTPEGEEIVKVVDFGIAKLLGEDDNEEYQQLTVTGGIVGTPTHIAPERAANLPYDGKSDVYSLGVTLYEMLSGRLPFPPGELGVIGMIMAHLNESPPMLSTIDGRIPPEIDEVVFQALNKTPAYRPDPVHFGELFAATVRKYAPDEPATSGLANRFIIDTSEDSLVQTLVHVDGARTDKQKHIFAMETVEDVDFGNLPTGTMTLPPTSPVESDGNGD